MVNGETAATLASSETRFVLNDGELGERYVFQVKVIGKDGRVISSLPVSVRWPGVTFPKQRVFVNGNSEVIITWGESTSISDGSIESFTVRTLTDNHPFPISSLFIARFICTILITIY